MPWAKYAEHTSSNLQPVRVSRCTTERTSANYAVADHPIALSEALLEELEEAGAHRLHPRSRCTNAETNEQILLSCRLVVHDKGALGKVPASRPVACAWFLHATSQSARIRSDWTTCCTRIEVVRTVSGRNRVLTNSEACTRNT